MRKIFLRKKHAYTATVFLIFSFLSIQSSFGQINNNRFRVDVTSEDMGPCGGSNDALTTVDILAKNNAVNNFEIAFNLPNGVSYTSGSVAIIAQEGTGDFSVTEVDIANLNAPVFRIQRPGDANWQVADRVRFTFYKTASCNAVQFSYAGGLFKDAHAITYDDINGPQTASDTDPTINSYNFLRAYLATQNYNSINAEVGDNISRTFEITNSGNGFVNGFIHRVVVGSDLSNYTLSFNGTALVPTISGNTYTYEILMSEVPFLGNIGDGDLDFENEIVLFEESFMVNGCSDTNVAHQPSWGCNPFEICQITEPVTGMVAIDNSLPLIKVTEIGDPGVTDLCLATPRTVRIANESLTTIAYNVEINTGYGPSNAVRTTNTANGLFGNDRPNISKSVDNFRFGTNPIITLPQRPTTQFSGVGLGSYFISEDYFTSDPDGPGGLEDLDGDGFFDDMAAGESTDLSYEETNSSLSASCGSTNFRYLPDYRLNTDAYAQNQCSTYIPTSRALVKYNFFERGNVLTTAPIDIFDGSPFNIGVQGLLRYSGSENLRCNGEFPFSNDPSSSWTVTLNVPEGILLNGNPAGYTQVDINTIVYTTTDMPTSSSLNLEINFPLTMDCATYKGPSEVPITYTTRYECSCFAEDIHCGTLSGIRSQCGGPCDGPTINAFDAQRETAGYTDDTMSTKVILDSAIHNLDTYLAKDEMVIRTSAIMSNSNPNNLLFDISYDTASTSAGGSDIIQFVDGTITINDISSGSPITVPLNAAIQPVLTTSGLNHTLTFDLSSYQSQISPTYTYGEPLLPGGVPEPDEVSLELHFVFNDVFTARTLYELENFNGEFYNNDILGNKVSCNILGDRAFYFKNIVNPYDRTSTTITGCTPNYVELLVQLLTVSGGDRFPNEFRPYFIWNSTEVEIPAGATFTGTVTSVDYPGTDPSTANGGLIATQTGNIVTVTPGPSLREWDVNGGHVPRIRVYFEGGITLAPSTPIFWLNNYQDFAYAPTPVAMTDSDSHPVLFNQPNYTLTTTTPIASGHQDITSFEATLCTSSTVDIDFNWIQINNGSDFTVTRVYEDIGGTQTLVPFTFAGGNTWVQLGAMGPGGNACRTIYFDTDYTNCSNFNFSAENAWSCDGYPSDFGAANYQNPLSFSLEPKEAVLQIALLNEPAASVDICSNFNIALEMRNAGNGDLVSPSLTFDIPGDASSLLLNGITVEYPQNSGDIQTLIPNLVGNTVTVNLIDHTAIAVNNSIVGSLNAASLEEQIAVIQLDLSVQCNFISNTAITYSAYGNNPCQSPATGNGSRLSTNPIVVTGADASYDAISTISVPSGGVFAGCNTETITFETTIVGGPTSNLDYARIVLPEGLAFDESSFTSNNAAYPVTFISVSTIGNHEEIIVTMPDNANNGASPSYSFDVTPKNTTATCSPGTRIEVYNFVVTSALVCGSVSCGTTEIAVGDTFENVIINKPVLAESAFNSNADYSTDENGNYEYHIEFGVENTGIVEIASGFQFDIYCADTSGSKTGSSIYSGTINQAIAAGGSIIEDFLFTSTDFCGDNANLIVEFVPSDTNCHCDILAIPIASEPELADLEITHTVDTPDAYIGDIVTFTINVLNNGPFDAANIVVEDLVPAGFTIATINDGGTATGNTISWPVFDLPNGSSTSFTFSAIVNTPTGATDEFTSIAQVVAVNQFDPNSTPNNYDGLPLENDEAIASIQVYTADLSITKGLSATSSAVPTIGETVTFEVTIENNGPDTANTVQIEDMVPSALTVNEATISNGGILTNNVISWNITSLNSGTDLVFSYDATINIPTGVTGELTNIAQVTASDEYDPNSTPNNYDATVPNEDDEAVYVTPIQTADLELINTISLATANPGDAVTVSVEINNTGPNDATNIAIENIVPPGLTVTNISNSGMQVGNTITWNGIDIPNGMGVIFTYDAVVNIQTNVVDEYLNTVQVTAADQYDLDSTPNNDDGDQSEDDEDSVLFTPISANLSLTKTLSAASNTQPDTGEMITFEITLTNAGPSEATNVSIEDVVPNGYALATIYDGGVLIGSSVTWNLASVPVGSQTFSYDAILNMPAGVPGEYNNVVQITASDQFDPNSAPNNDDGDQSEDDEASYSIASPTIDIGISKIADKTVSFFEDTIVFTITAVNNSQYMATNLGIEDILPPGFQLVSHSSDIGNYDEASSIWEIPSLLANETASLEMTVLVTETDGYTNLAQLAYLDQVDIDSSNDISQVTITITRDECLTVYNQLSPNGDGANDTFFIQCIEQYPNNFLQIFNRWGTKVFDMEGYDNTWNGESTGRATIGAERKLPVGTYFYTLEPRDGVTKPRTGWLYISS